MSNYELTETPGTYRVYFKEYGITITISQLRTERDEIKGEALIETNLPGTEPHIHQARFNLTSTTSRKTLQKLCEERLEEIPWHQLIEIASVTVMRKSREGEPTVQLSQVDHQSKLQYRINPLFPEGMMSLMYGPGGIGKSYFALWLAAMVDSGLSPPNTNLEVEPGNVLYLDYEEDKEALARRYSQIMAGAEGGMEPPTDSIRYRFCHRPLSRDLDEIRKIIHEHRIEFVIIDSCVPAVGGEPESADKASEYLSALRSLRVSSLTLAHTSKQGDGPFGSVFFTNLPRSVFEVKATQEPESDTLHLGLYHKKVNSGRLLKPMGFQLKWAGEALSVRSVQVRDIPDLEEGLPLKERIANILTTGKQTIEDMAEQLETTQATIRTKLNSDKNRFTKMGREWGLAAPPTSFMK